MSGLNLQGRSNVTLPGDPAHFLVISSLFQFQMMLSCQCFEVGCLNLFTVAFFLLLISYFIINYIADLTEKNELANNAL